MHFDTPVKINEITATKVEEIKYDSSRFEFGDVPHDPETVKNLGYAGFRVLYPINKADKQDEIMTLLGPATSAWSARAMCTACRRVAWPSTPRCRRAKSSRASPSSGSRSPPADKHLVIYALLDSPRSTGAYKLILRPGTDTVVDVQSRVFLRDQVSRLGIAPLTSMFLFGPNQPSKVLNYRPALHDSEGLSIHAGNGEWLWRPLNNPKHLAVSNFSVENPRGFGLMQRQRAFSDFEDLDDNYQKRPSAWIEPKGDWGKGTVDLVEIPTADETNDNIVAFWSPEKLPEPGKPFEYAYRLHWTIDEQQFQAPDLGWVKQTLRSTGDVKQSNLIRQPDGSVAFLVDFAGPALAALPEDTPVRSQISVGDNAEVVENNLRYNPETKGWRLTLRLKVKEANKSTEMRAALVRDVPVEAAKPAAETKQEKAAAKHAKHEKTAKAEPAKAEQPAADAAPTNGTPATTEKC